MRHRSLGRFGGKRGVRGAECGKCRVWKMRSVENAKCGNYVEHFNFNTKLTNNLIPLYSH